MAIFKSCSCEGGQKVNWIVSSSAICITWISILGKFFIGEACYHDNEKHPVLPSLLLISALSQLFLVAVAISIAVDSYRNYAQGITIFIFLLNVTLILIGLIFVIKGWNSVHVEPGSIIPVSSRLNTVSTHETNSQKNISMTSATIFITPTAKALSEASVQNKKDLLNYQESCRFLILVCATVAFPVDGLLTLSLIFLFIFLNKFKNTQDASQDLPEDEIVLLELAEYDTKRILKEE